MEWSKIIFIYFCMALAVSFFFPQVVLTENTTILGIFDVGYNTSNNEVYVISSGFANADIDSEVNAPSTSKGLFQRGVDIVTNFFQFVVDGLSNIIGTLAILFKFLFSPFIFIASPNLLGTAPFYVKLIFALPLVFLAFEGYINYIGGRR